MVAVQFLLHALCATGVCLPHFQSPAPNQEFTELRTGRSDFNMSSRPQAFPASGALEGIVMQTIKGRPIGAFMGIPYALPPIDDLRFRPPQRMSPWEGVRQANKTSHLCLQIDPAQYFYVVGREDCLYLNIYTPSLPRDGVLPKLPVIVYIHGGAYLFGGGSDLGPAYFLDNDVILVTFNYRLGALGFFSTGDAASPGNNGMKDQALALRWVQENIASFGGDPDRITFMGQSAGASSVGLHLMSDLSKDIPYTAVMHSGSAHQEWTLVNATVKNSQIIAQTFKCPMDSFGMVECLRAQNPYFIVFRTMKTFKTFFYPALPFGPVIETPHSGAFLTLHPKDAYAQGKVRNVPVISGIVENEGDLFTFETVLYPGLLRAINRRWFQMAPYILDYATTTPKPDVISSKIKQYYFANRTINFYTRDRISKMLGDRWVVTGVHKGMQYHSALAPTYGYTFTYKGRYSVAKPLSLNRADWGVTHLDDVSYFLNSTLYFEPMKLEDPEFIISEFLTNVWSNFAATGKPYYVNNDGEDVSFWKPINDPFNMNLIDISEKVRQVKFPFQDRIKFWQNLNFTDDYEFPRSLAKKNIESSAPQKVSTTSEEYTLVSSTTMKASTTEASTEQTRKASMIETLEYTTHASMVEKLEQTTEPDLIETLDQTTMESKTETTEETIESTTEILEIV